jgi:hypothetical protein
MAVYSVSTYVPINFSNVRVVTLDLIPFIRDVQMMSEHVYVCRTAHSLQ